MLGPPQNHQSKELLLFDLSGSSLDTLTSRSLCDMTQSLLRVNNFSSGVFIKNNQQQLFDTALAWGGNSNQDKQQAEKKLKRKSKVHKDLWKSLTHPWESRRPHICMGLYACPWLCTRPEKWRESGYHLYIFFVLSRLQSKPWVSWYGNVQVHKTCSLGVVSLLRDQIYRQWPDNRWK